MVLCYICHDKIKNDICTLDCKHQYHIECIKQIRRLACPACNKEITELPDNIMNNIQKRIKEDKELREIIDELDILLDELNDIAKRSQVIVMNTN